MTREEAFETFWAAYPRRVGKGAAREKFAKAIKKTTLDVMLTAIADYIRHKPDRIDFKHPATWLHQECWCDEWQSVPQRLDPPRRTMADLADELFTGANHERLIN